MFNYSYTTSFEFKPILNRMIILTFEIHDLVVDQDQRNRGLGTRLWQYLID